MFTAPIRVKALTTAVATFTLAAALLGAGPAVAKSGGDDHPRGHAGCTITATQRAETLDKLLALKAQLEGHELTRAEKDAVREAAAEMVTAARDAKMSKEVKAAKREELRALAGQLKRSTSAAERAAVRTQIRAIVLELDDARLTSAERAEIAEKVKDLVRSLKAKPTGAEREQIRAEVKVLAKQLECKVAG